MKNELYERMKKIAEGRVHCACANCDWEEFLYLEGGERVIAACKQCGRTYAFNPKTKTWVIMGGPAPKP